MPAITNKSMVGGYIMAVVGFIFIIYNAVNYIFGLKLDAPSSAIGIVFLATGMGIVRNSKKGKTEKTE